MAMALKAIANRSRKNLALVRRGGSGHSVGVGGRPNSKQRRGARLHGRWGSAIARYPLPASPLKGEELQPTVADKRRPGSGSTTFSLACPTRHIGGRAPGLVPDGNRPELLFHARNPRFPAIS